MPIASITTITTEMLECRRSDLNAKRTLLNMASPSARRLVSAAPQLATKKTSTHFLCHFPIVAGAFLFYDLHGSETIEGLATVPKPDTVFRLRATRLWPR